MKQAIILDPADLDKLIASVTKAIVEEVRKIINESKAPDRLLTRKEAAVLMGVHETTIDTWKRTGIIPSSMVHRYGKQPRFKASELMTIDTKKS